MPTWTRHLYEHNPLAIAKGEVNGYSVVHKFGANFDIDNGSEPETVWTGGGLYPWSSLATAQTLYVLSESSEDTGTLEIQGLDENYNLQTEDCYSYRDHSSNHSEYFSPCVSYDLHRWWCR
jgi:hypothetical protein